MDIIIPEDIKKIQLDILIRFARFCEKNNLYYTLYGGTLLGAIRHRGFIPWDDDIDVAMPRLDYEKLIEFSKINMIDTNLKVLHYKLGNNTYPFVKIIDTRTVVEEKGIGSIKIGIWIDVFPIDGNFKNKFLYTLQYSITWVLEQMIFIQRSDFGGGNTNIKRVCKALIYPIAKILPNIFLCNTLDKICCIKRFENSEVVGNIVWHLGICAKMKKEDFLKNIKVEFEGYKFNAPLNFHECLHSLYGNYMELPPENKRICHDFKAWWRVSESDSFKSI